MAHEEVDDLAVNVDRNVPVALRRQPEDAQLGRAVPVGRRRGRRIIRKARVRHVLPEKVLEGPHLVVQDRVLREDRHSELSREEAKPERVVRTRDNPVVVQVEARRDPGVRRGDEDVRIDDRGGSRAAGVVRQVEVVLLEGLCQRVVRLEVELVDKEHLRPDSLDDLRHSVCLGVARHGELRQRLSSDVTVERCVEGREPDGRLDRGRVAGRSDQARDHCGRHRARGVVGRGT